MGLRAKHTVMSKRSEVQLDRGQIITYIAHKCEGIVYCRTYFRCGQVFKVLWHWCLFTPGSGDVWFSLRGTTYQNNSLVTLEDIGQNDTALVCMTNFPACCRPPYTSENRSALGNWFFPNGTRVPSKSKQCNFYRSRSQMVLHLHRRRGGEEGIYRCEIPDSMNVTQTIYIGVYTANTSTGEWRCL